MAQDAQWWLVCYDVRDAKRLRETAKHLQGYGHRMQYSVFRCWMTPLQMQRLRWELTEILETEDDLLLIPLCARCVAGLEVAHSTSKQANWPDAPATHTIV